MDIAQSFPLFPFKYKVDRFHAGCVSAALFHLPLSKRTNLVFMAFHSESCRNNTSPITSVCSLVEHFHRLACSHPSSAAAIKSKKLSCAVSLLSIKHLRESDKTAAAVKTLLGPRWELLPLHTDSRGQQAGQTGIKAVGVICDYCSSLQGILLLYHLLLFLFLFGRR